MAEEEKETFTFLEQNMEARWNTPGVFQTSLAAYVYKTESENEGKMMVSSVFCIIVTAF